MFDREGLERLAEMLGGWPDYFQADQVEHGLRLLGQLRRDRLIDEGVFGMVIRYAVHRAAWDQIGRDILEGAKAEAKPGDADWLSPMEQQRAYHGNKIGALEKALIATPYERARQTGSAQSSFMPILDEAPKEEGGGDTVMPFAPLKRKQT